MDQIPNLEFSEKYDDEHARAYSKKHRDGIARRLSNQREQSLARKALELAGNPQSVFDFPCGTGRFWKMLSAAPQRKLLAADLNYPMLTNAINYQPADITKRFRCFQASAFAIPLRDNAVDCVFCMRLIHHIGERQYRLAILTEFARVARQSVCLSLWVDGNWQARHRKRLEQRRTANHILNRFVLPRKKLPAEFYEAGFEIIGYLDLLKGFSLWRTYVLHKSNAHNPRR